MSRAAIIEPRLDVIHDMPISLPQVELREADSIVVAFFKLELGQRLDITWLCFKLLKASLGVPVKVNASLGLAYAGIYVGGFDMVRRPSGTPVHTISLSGPVSRLLSPYVTRSFFGPDVVEVVVVNNTSNLVLEVTLTGAAKFMSAG